MIDSPRFENEEMISSLEQCCTAKLSVRKTNKFRLIAPAFYRGLIKVKVLQDELLTTGITLNVLEARASKLEEENRELLDRWLAKVKADADSLNEANEFLEQIRGMRMASPIIGGEDATASLEENRGESKE